MFAFIIGWFVLMFKTKVAYLHYLYKNVPKNVNKNIILSKLNFWVEFSPVLNVFELFLYFFLV